MAIGSKSARDKLKKTGGSAARARGPFGSLSAREKLKKTGGGAARKAKATQSARKFPLGNVLGRVGSAAALAKLRSSGTKSAAVAKLKKTGGGAANKAGNPKSRTKAMQEYYNRMRDTHKKFGIKTRRKKGYSI